ncbi:MAG: DNA repair protein RecN [Lachnospiraceae bacterium]|nr:DNA repair protein RecN [Lachnospiraceae bacterium]
MLTNLHVKNLALIDEIEVEFGSGLNILTGETGAGKSIIIGSINLALGKKMSRDMIREGKDSALVELIFQTENPKVLEKLNKMELDSTDGQVIISRKFVENRSISKINGETCTVNQIKELAEDLLDIHGQHEHQSLLYRERQLEILDAFGGKEILSLRGNVENCWISYRTLQKEMKTYELDEEARSRELAFLEFEIQEIEDAALREGEDLELETRFKKMSNARKIAEGMNQVHNLTGYEGENGAGEQVGRAVRELSQAAEYDGELAELCTMLNDIDGILNDFNREVSRYLDDLTFEEEEFYETEKRLDLLNHLKAKYGSSISEILEYQKKQSEKLEMLQNFEARKAKVLSEYQKSEEILEKASDELSKKRQTHSKKLSADIIEELRELNFADVRFEISFTRTQQYGRDGFDMIEFLISTNPGEPVKPLAKVVSGGELSRIMLAIKTILADKDETETLIFDEIDTGISGRTAQKVSEKMARIGRNHQVLCITHLPQIAAMADRHFEILKYVEKQETITTIRPLSSEDSAQELARILGGARITDAVVANAKEMQELAKVYKSSRL